MRYILFAGDMYFPSGGAEDILATSDDLEELETRGKSCECDWSHIYDTKIGTTVWEG